MNTNVHVDEAPVARNALGDIIFRVGQKLHFIATRTFSLGQAGIQIREGSDILFDGQKAEIDGVEYPLPGLRGAIRQRWIVPVQEYDPSDPTYGQRIAANIQVRHATQGGNPMQPNQRMSLATTENDEREVGNVRSHAASTKNANAGFVRGRTGVNVVQPGTTVQTQHGMMVVEAQDGVEVPGRTLKTAAGERAKNTRTELTSEKASELLRQASNVQIDAGRGLTQEEMLERMAPEQREEYLAKKEAYRQQYVSEPVAPTRTVGRVAAPKKIESSGMTVTGSVGGGTSISDGEGEVVATVKQDAVESFEQEGLRFTTTNGPRRAPVARLADAAPAPKLVAGPSAEVRLKLAKQICPDFPDNYNFSLPPKKKLARITADYEDRSDVIRAIFAAEDDEMKGLLVQEFPHVFA